MEDEGLEAPLARHGAQLMPGLVVGPQLGADEQIDKDHIRRVDKDYVLPALEQQRAGRPSAAT